MKYLVSIVLIICAMGCTHTGNKAEVVIRTWENKPKPAGCVHVILDGKEKARVCGKKVLLP